MSTSNKYLSLFPMEVEVTEEMIEEGTKHLEDCRKCIGALTLRKGLGDNISLLSDDLTWGTYGSYNMSGSMLIVISSHDSDGKEVNMMEVTEPCTITLKN